MNLKKFERKLKKMKIQIFYCGKLQKKKINSTSLKTTSLKKLNRFIKKI